MIEAEGAAVVVTDDQLSGVALRSGALIRRDPVVVVPRFLAEHGVLDDLGVNVADNPSVSDVRSRPMPPALRLRAPYGSRATSRM